MSAALVDAFAGRTVHSARILGARSGHDLNAVAAEIATDPDVDAEERARLQLLFASRMRQLYPNSFRRSR